jgi:hypothetical protein
MRNPLAAHPPWRQLAIISVVLPLVIVVAVTDVDVVPTSASDPRGMVLSSVLLPLTICSIIIAAAVGLIVGFRPAWRQILALAVVSAVAGFGQWLPPGAAASRAQQVRGQNAVTAAA